MAVEPLFVFIRPLSLMASKLLGHRVIVTGEENIPRSGGALFTINHTGYLDFYFSAFGLLKARRKPRFMAKHEAFENKVAGFFLRTLHQIPVDRIAGNEALKIATKHLKNGEVVCIFPEGTMSQSWEIKELKTGAVRIAQEAGVSIYPAIVWGSQRVWRRGGSLNTSERGIGIRVHFMPEFSVEGDPEEVSQRLRHTMQAELERIQDEYDELFGPFEKGLPWMPRRRGGSAPTLEEAQAEDDRVDRARGRARKMMLHSQDAADEVHAAVLHTQRRESDALSYDDEALSLARLRLAAEKLASSAEEISQASKMEGEEVRRKYGEGSLRAMTESVATAAMELERVTMLSSRRTARRLGRQGDAITDFASGFRHRTTKNLYAGAEYLAQKAQSLLHTLEAAERKAQASAAELRIKHAIAREKRYEQTTADRVRQENRPTEIAFKQADAEINREVKRVKAAEQRAAKDGANDE